MESILNVLYFVGVGLVAYAFWKWRKAKSDILTLSEIKELKGSRKRYILLSILGIALVIIASIFR